MFQLIVIIACAAALYLLRLDFIIHTQFEGRHWPLPARLYATPFDIYPGRLLTPAELERVLLASAYNATDKLMRPGQYRRGPAALDIFTRRFDYWEGSDPPRRIRVLFGAGGVSGITDLAGVQSAPIVRIEPPLIGRIYPQTNEDRLPVSYAATPRSLIDGLIAVEDKRFFRHSGIDSKAMLRALWTNLVHGEISQGGSTLTQQLVKNFFLTGNRTFHRKVNEILMALLLERRYSKAQILEAYINEVFLGQHGGRAIHGFGSAAEFYFGRPLNELGIEQTALLVGLVRGASFYNPRRHLQRALDRRNLVLDLMEQQHYLSASVAAAARARPLGITEQPQWTQARYPAFIDVVRRQLQQDYRIRDLQTAGLRIFTTVDPALQELAVSVTRVTLAGLERQKGLPAGTLEAAVALMQISSGELVALVGGRSDATGEFNRSISARRPIGSLVKPFIYLTALSNPARYNVLSLIDDSALALKQPGTAPWRPKNYDGAEHGRVSILEALAQSYNLATVRLGLELGLADIIATLQRGATIGPIDPLPSVLLGAVELSPLEVAQLYQSLANGGFRVPARGIREVVDSDGHALQRYELKMDTAFDPRAAFLTNFLLTAVTAEGTARGLETLLPGGLPVAGKTGTTDDLRDSWFAGFGDGLLAVAWVGRDDNRPIGLSGANGAMKVWAALMRAAKLQPVQLRAPAGVVWVRNVPLRYRGECRILETVPFIEPYPPTVPSAC